MHTFMVVGIDIAFIVAVFSAPFLVGPDLHIENGRSLLEFRDPLSLRPKTEVIGADENYENDEKNC